MLPELLLGMPVEIRHVTAEDMPRARRFYADRQYGGGICPADSVLLAEHEGKLVGIVRLAPEEGTVVLRGMQIHPAFRRQGIGMRLLAEIARTLGTQSCYCIPYAYLANFYRRIEFVGIDPAEAPFFLRSRLAGYQQRGDGKEYLLMRRKKSPGVP